MRRDLREAAKDALTKGKDKPDLAVKLLKAKATSEPKLRDDLLLLGAQQVIRDFFSRERQSAMSMAVARAMSPAAGDRIAARLRRHAFWESYTLYGMEPIKTATKSDLQDSAKARTTQANGDLVLAKFELTVARRLPTPTTRVDAVLTSEQIEKIAVRFRLGDS